MPEWRISQKIELPSVKEITNIEEDLVNFPLLLRCRNNLSLSNARKDGSDVCIVTGGDDPVELPIDFRYWLGGGGAAVNFDAFICVPLISGNNPTELFIKAGCYDPSWTRPPRLAPQMVWRNAGYDGVWKFKENKTTNFITGKEGSFFYDPPEVEGILPYTFSDSPFGGALVTAERVPTQLAYTYDVEVSEGANGVALFKTSSTTPAAGSFCRFLSGTLPGGFSFNKLYYVINTINVGDTHTFNLAEEYKYPYNGIAYESSGENVVVRCGDTRYLLTDLAYNGDENYAIESWIYPTTFVGYTYGNVFSAGVRNNFVFAVYNRLLAYIAGVGSSAAYSVVPWPRFTWYHVAIQRKGDKTYWYLNGKKQPDLSSGVPDDFATNPIIYNNSEKSLTLSRYLAGSTRHPLGNCLRLINSGSATCPSEITQINNSFTCDFWFYNFKNSLVHKGWNTSNNRAFSFVVDTESNGVITTYLYTRISDTGSNEYLSKYEINNNIWNHVALVGGNSSASLYINGELIQNNLKFPFQSTSALYLGTGSTVAVTGTGCIDDFRFSSVERSAAWINYQYRNIADNDFFKFNSVQTATNKEGWSYFVPVGFRRSNEVLVNFPLQLICTVENGENFAAAQNDGRDILITNSDGTEEYKHWICYWRGGAGASAEFTIIIKIPTVRTDIEWNYIRVYFGNDSATSSSDIRSVWDDNYTAVHGFDVLEPNVKLGGGLYSRFNRGCKLADCRVSRGAARSDVWWAYQYANMLNENFNISWDPYNPLE